MSSLSVKSIRNTLSDFFTETFESVSGIYLDRGTSLFETLETISAEIASSPVSANCATIAAQVEHVRYYLDVLEVYMTGGKPENVDWKHIWNTVRTVTPQEWEDSKARLRDSYQRVTTSLKSIVDDAWNDETPMPDALAIIVHTAYHLGEIRQALCTLGERP
jgi:uncharacterized damage-inducible protein DinB